MDDKRKNRIGWVVMGVALLLGVCVWSAPAVRQLSCRAAAGPALGGEVYPRVMAFQAAAAQPGPGTGATVRRLRGELAGLDLPACVRGSQGQLVKTLDVYLAGDGPGSVAAFGEYVRMLEQEAGR